MEAYEAEDSEYFIGSVITIEKERDRRYDVVDGQQRLTTLNLILARLRNHITDEAAKADLGKRILPRDVYTGEAETPRLLLRKKDETFFRKHILEGRNPSLGKTGTDWSRRSAIFWRTARPWMRFVETRHSRRSSGLPDTCCRVFM